MILKLYRVPRNTEYKIQNVLGLIYCAVVVLFCFSCCCLGDNLFERFSHGGRSYMHIHMPMHFVFSFLHWINLQVTTVHSTMYNSSASTGQESRHYKAKATIN